MNERYLYKKNFKQIWKIFSDNTCNKKHKNKFQILLNGFAYSDDFSTVNDAVLLAERLQKDDGNLYFDDLCNLYLGIDGMKCFGSYTYQITKESSLIMYHINDLCSYNTYMKYKSNFNGFLCMLIGVDKNQLSLIENQLINQSSDIKVLRHDDSDLIFTIYFDNYDYEGMYQLYTEISYVRDLLLHIITPDIEHLEKDKIEKGHFKWFHNILCAIMY